MLSVTSGKGNDTLSVKGMSAAGSTFLDGGNGVDSGTVDFSHATASVTGSYAGTGLVSDGTTSVSLFNLEHLGLIGGSANDTLKGNAGDDVLDGEAGNDTLSGGTGTNVLNGEAGDDTMFDSGLGKTAKALDLDVPAMVLARANEVIE